MRLLIAGSGIAAISAAESFLKSAPGGRVSVVSRESDAPYYRLNLTRYLAGELAAAKLPLHPLKWYEDKGIELLLGNEVSQLDIAGCKAILSGGQEISWDRLVLATGASPFFPPIPGIRKNGITGLSTLADADLILSASRPGVPVVVVGGGLLGLEVAAALASRKADVTVLEGAPWLMPRQLPERGAGILSRRMAAMNMRLVCSAKIEAFEGESKVSAVRIKDGGLIPAALVVVAAGVRPNADLAARAGLSVKSGIVVDDLLRTSSPAVFSAGDAAEHRGLLYGSWKAAQTQGEIAGINAAGGAVEFKGIPRSHAIKVLGLSLASVGRFEPEGVSDVVLESEDSNRYFRFVFRDGRMAGAVMLGDSSLYAKAVNAIEGAEDFSAKLSDATDAVKIMEGLKK